MRFTSQLIAIVTGLFIAHLAAAASPEPQRCVRSLADAIYADTTSLNTTASILQ